MGVTNLANYRMRVRKFAHAQAVACALFSDLQTEIAGGLWPHFDGRFAASIDVRLIEALAREGLTLSDLHAPRPDVLVNPRAAHSEGA